MPTISQQLTELVNRKNQLAENLTTKGVSASSSETLNTLVPKVLEITSSGVVPDKIVQSEDYEYNRASEIVPSNDVGFHVIGTSFTESTLFEIGSGVEMDVHNDEMATYLGLTSDMIVSGNTILGIEGTAISGSIDTSDATATANKILDGYTAYADGVKIIGNIPSKQSQTYVPSNQNQEIISGVYLEGNQTIQGDSNLIPANIKKSVEIFGVTGTYEGSSHGEQIILDCRNMNSSEEVLTAYQDTIVVSNDGTYSTFEPIGSFIYNIITVGYLQNTAGVNFNAQTNPAGFYFKTPVHISSSTVLLNIIFYVSTWINPTIKFHVVDGDTEAAIQQNIVDGAYVFTQDIVLSNSRNNTFDLIRLDNVPIGNYHIFIEMTTAPGGNEAILNYLSVVEL